MKNGMNECSELELGENGGTDIFAVRMGVHLDRCFHVYYFGLPGDLVNAFVSSLQKNVCTMVDYNRWI